jgi:hydroxyacylglutathione hydrolase
MNEHLAKDGLHQIEEIAPQTFRLDEGGMCNAYLVLGKDKALLIDSGVGAGDIYEACQELTSLPIELAVTHRHCDHDGGRGYFRQYYAHKSDKGLIYDILSSKFACQQLLKANGKSDVALSKKPYRSKPIYIDDDFAFELGGRKITLFNVPGHTKGSIVFIDESSHLMFTGDEVNPYLWMQLPGSTSLATWLIGAKKIEALAKDHKAYGGHDKGYIPAEGISQVIKVGEEILEKKIQCDGKNLDYPFDKTVFPRILVSKKNLKQ